MKFTKLTLIAVLMALLLCAFAACGKPAETESGNETEAGNETVADSQTDAAPAETDPVPETDAETEHVHTPVEVIEEATCSSRGYKREMCSECEEQLSVKPLDMIDHIEAAPATCETASICKFCGTQMQAAIGHKVETITDSKEATPEENGYEKGNCVHCGKEITKTLIFTNAVTFDKLAEGTLNADDFKVNGFETNFTKGTDAYTVVKEGTEQFLSKSDALSPLYFKDQTGAFGTQKFEIAFDLRIDGDTGNNSGILALNDRTAGNGDEMRVLSWATDAKDGSTIIYFGEPSNSGVAIKTIAAGNRDWINVRVVVDPVTVNYEVYFNGSKAAYSTSDEAAPGGHMVWTPKDGEWVSQSKEGFGNTEKQSPFTNVGEGIKGVYMFHYSNRPCSLDNFDIHLIAE